MLNSHRSNLRINGERRGFHGRHWPRLELAARLVEALPSDVPANEWLKTPHPKLSGRSPLDLISAYGPDAPIPESLFDDHSGLLPLDQRRWWTTWLALLEVPGSSSMRAMQHLRRTLPQRGRNGDEVLTVDVRWAWAPDGYDTTFIVAEIGSLHEPGAAAGHRWDGIIHSPLLDCEAWYGLGYAEPLREALLTHWHREFDEARVTSSLHDAPVPVDDYDATMFARRRLVRPSSPPWDLREGQPIMQYLRRLADGGPRPDTGYWPFPTVRNGCKAEMLTLWHPFSGDSPRAQCGSLYRYRFDFGGREHVNTAVRESPDEGIDPGDPRAVRLVHHPDAKP